MCPGSTYYSDMLKDSAFEDLPTTPGVYQFKNASGTILYIGKARNLRSRLSNYKNESRLDSAKRQMVREASKLTYKEVETEIAALLLEASLIKQYRPKYNILMRDDKNYTFIGFTKDDFPKIFVTHQPISSWAKKKSSTASNDDLIGPFTESKPVREVLHTLRKIFPYCTCRRKHSHKRPCINTQIGKCSGWCCTNKEIYEKHSPLSYTEAKRIYRKNIQSIKRILSGKQQALLGKIEKEMSKASEEREYETAAILHKQHTALKRVFAHKEYVQHDVLSDRAKGLRLLGDLLQLSGPATRIEGYDISNIQGTNPVGSMVVFVDGVPEKHEYRKFIIKSVKGINDPAMMQEMLIRRLKHKEWKRPDVLLIDGGPTQLNAATSAASLTHSKVAIASLAKREEELYIPGQEKPVPLKNLSPHLLHLLQHVRDESHRAAVGFHRKRRSKKLLE